MPKMIRKFLHRNFSNISNPSFGPDGGCLGQFSKLAFYSLAFTNLTINQHNVGHLAQAAMLFFLLPFFFLPVI